MIRDAIVIGAGPAGLLAATEIATKGYDVQVIEEHEQIGEPDHCAGLLSTSGLKRLGLKIPDRIVQNYVTGARIYSPAGHSIVIKRKQREANVIDRRLFDAWLASRAMDSGVEVTTNVRAKEFYRKNGKIKGIRASSDKEQALDAKVFVIAEGFRCRLSGSIGYPVVQKSSKLPAFQYEVSDVDIDETMVEMFYGQNVAPGFFSWIIPLGGGRARVGLAAKNRAKLRLNRLLKYHPIISKRMHDAKIERSLGGVVLAGMPISKMAIENTIAIGDTAGIVKATTGGGVILGGLTARVGGKVVANALRSKKSVSLGLSQFTKKCKAMIMKELRMMHLVQMALTSLDDKGLDSIIKDAARMGLLKIITSEGDMDFQGRVITRLLKDPRMLLTGLRAIRYINPFL